MKYLIAIAIGLAIWWISIRVVRMLASPPPEIDPDDVVATEQNYRCSICGTEVTMTVTSLSGAAAPKHCREEMDPV